MTFEEFQSTKVWSDDMSEFVGRGDDEPTPPCGFVYTGSFYIESTKYWPESAPAYGKGAWYLIIERSEWVDNDLERLERILWDDFAEAEINHRSLPHRDDGRGFCIDCGDAI